jgi:hypothetical protein
MVFPQVDHLRGLVYNQTGFSVASPIPGTTGAEKQLTERQIESLFT